MQLLSYPYDRKNFQLAIVQTARTGKPHVIEKVDSEPMVVMTVKDYNAKVDAADRIDPETERALPLTKLWETIESIDGELNIKVLHRDG